MREPEYCTVENVPVGKFSLNLHSTKMCKNNSHMKSFHYMYSTENVNVSTK